MAGFLFLRSFSLSREVQDGEAHRRKKSERKREREKELKLNQSLLAMRGDDYVILNKLVPFHKPCELFLYLRKDTSWRAMISHVQFNQSSREREREDSHCWAVCLVLFNKQAEHNMCKWTEMRRASDRRKRKMELSCSFSCSLCSSVRARVHAEVLITSTSISIEPCKQTIVDTSHIHCRRRRRRRFHPYIRRPLSVNVFPVKSARVRKAICLLACLSDRLFRLRICSASSRVDFSDILLSFSSVLMASEREATIIQKWSTRARFESLTFRKAFAYFPILMLMQTKLLLSANSPSFSPLQGLRAKRSILEANEFIQRGRDAAW